MKNPLFLPAVVCAVIALPSSAAWADQACTGPIGKFEIKEDHILFEGKKFPLDKEVIEEAYGITSEGFMSSSAKSECRAKTHMAKRSAGGEIILVKMHKAKISRSAGQLCSFSRYTSNYSEPYAFEQIVLKPGKSGTMAVSVLRIYDGIGRPEVKTRELLNPDLSTTHEGLKKFLQEQAMGPYRKAFQNTGSVACQSESGHLADAKPPITTTEVSPPNWETPSSDEGTITPPSPVHEKEHEAKEVNATLPN